MKPLLSIISPVYQAESSIDELIKQINQSVRRITDNYEIILVDDRGPDQSWKKIQAHCATDNKIKGIRLSRNFGQHFAITAGIDFAKGDFLVILDCDLQDNPEYIVDMYNKSLEGNDIVYTIKKERKHSFFKNITASLFNRVFNYLMDNPAWKASKNVGAYSLINRKVAEAFKQYNDYQRHYLMVLRWLGFTHCYLEIEHRERYAGKSSYNFSKLMKHAINGITSQSDKLLRIFVTIGLTISVLSFLLIAIIILMYFTHGFLSGWASTIVTLLFSTGIILTGIGVLGIYLGKTFEQSKNRPKYIVDQILNSKID
jgi:dolichol-phosphate mannosyltransferase